LELKAQVQKKSKVYTNVKFGIFSGKFFPDHVKAASPRPPDRDSGRNEIPYGLVR
jgi:hypothetical protein